MVSRNLGRANENDGFKMTALEQLLILPSATGTGCPIDGSSSLVLGLFCFIQDFTSSPVKKSMTSYNKCYVDLLLSGGWQGKGQIKSS